MRKWLRPKSVNWFMSCRQWRWTRKEWGIICLMRMCLNHKRRMRDRLVLINNMTISRLIINKVKIKNKLIQKNQYLMYWQVQTLCKSNNPVQVHLLKNSWNNYLNTLRLNKILVILKKMEMGMKITLQIIHSNKIVIQHLWI